MPSDSGEHALPERASGDRKTTIDKRTRISAGVNNVQYVTHRHRY
jgi:hypothetical protein